MRKTEGGEDFAAVAAAMAGAKRGGRGGRAGARRLAGRAPVLHHGRPMDLKQSSRARLTRATVCAFPGETLFDRLGRAVSEAECLPRKELFEAWEVARRVRRRFRGGPIFDLAAGHGLAAWALLLLDDSSPGAVCVDRRRPASAGRLEEALCARWPRLAGRVRYHEERLDRSLELVRAGGPGAVVVSVHACGRLTDLAIDVALAARARLAVLPCCQSLSKCDTGPLEPWLDGPLAVDVTRVHRLERAGYRVHLQTIPAEITPKNRLILAAPRDPAGAGGGLRGA